MDVVSIVFKLRTSFLLILGFFNRYIFAVEPNFDVPVVNITVVAGKTAILPCSVEFLGDRKVVWTDKWQTLLTLEAKRIIDDERMGIDRPYTNDWNLIIHDVKYEDRGRYVCQINTSPIKTKAVELVVLVPPKILESSSNDVKAKEGETITLTCNVTGVPSPTVQWYRRPFGDNMGHQKERLRTSIRSGLYKQDKSSPDKSCFYTVQQKVLALPVEPKFGETDIVNDGVGLNGEILIIHNVSRYCDGIYECMAFNDVEPAVNREMKVEVEFAPEVFIKETRMGQYVGKETILECDVVAFPQAYSVWQFHGREITSKKDKVRLDVYTENDNFITLSIRLLNLTTEDFGEYTCVAENKLGKDEESMYLYETRPKATTTPEPLTRRPYVPYTTPSSNVHIPDNEDKDNYPIYVPENGGPVAGHSSMGNGIRTLHLSSMCFLPFSIFTTLLWSLW